MPTDNPPKPIVPWDPIHASAFSGQKFGAARFFALLLFGLPVLIQAEFIFATNINTLTVIGYTGHGGAVTVPAQRPYLHPTIPVPGLFKSDRRANSE